MIADRKGAMPASSARFNALRARLEVELERPATIAVTSCTATDGKEIAARGLASSLATAGYRTLFVDTSAAGRGRSRVAPGTPIEEIARMHLAAKPGSAADEPAVLHLGDPQLQRTVSQRALQTALDLLRDTYDFIVCSSAFDVACPFSTGLLAGADAIVATVRTGRRATADDARLAAALDRIGSRYLGVIALDAAVIRAETAADTVPSISESFTDASRSHVHAEGERARREIVESPT